MAEGGKAGVPSKTQDMCETEVVRTGWDQVGLVFHLVQAFGGMGKS